MAASDYEIRGESGLCPFGVLALGIDREATTISIEAFQGVEPNDIVIGMGALIGDEVVRVIDNLLPNITVARGCADTIPQVHAASTEVWFFSEAAGSDGREYLATDTVAVKLLPFTAASAPVPIDYAPPNEVTFNWRAFRPYAPGNLQCQGAPWFQGPFTTLGGETELLFTWNHRDRLLQADQLIGHTEGSIGPEPGTTYRIRVYDSTDTLVRSVDGITAESWAYTDTMRAADLPTGSGRLVLYSVRDGFESYSQYEVLIGNGGGGGLGESLGENLGG